MPGHVLDHVNDPTVFARRGRQRSRYRSEHAKRDGREGCAGRDHEPIISLFRRPCDRVSGVPPPTRSSCRQKLAQPTVAIRFASSHLGDIPGMPNPPPGYPRVSPYLLYEDAAAAIDYLQRTFGFVVRLTQIGAAGRSHNELLLGDDGLVMLGQAGESFSSPRTLDISPASMIHIYVDDVESLHARAKTAGADVSDLELSPAGDRRFTATDPEGQIWVFAQRVAPPTS
jgi:uncharacterized glyoxalase superfamily protein PhnB